MRKIKSITVTSEPFIQKGHAGRSSDMIVFDYEGDAGYKDIVVYDRKSLFVDYAIETNGVKTAKVMNVDLRDKIEEFGIEKGDKLDYVRYD